jgi:hypothetical protein
MPGTAKRDAHSNLRFGIEKSEAPILSRELLGKKKQEASECDVDSSSLTEEGTEDRVAAIVDALCHLKDRSIKRIQRKRTAKTHEFKRLPKWLSNGSG